MELFNRRYLCFFAFLFLVSAFVATLVSGIVQVAFAIVAAVLAIVATVLLIFNKKLRFSAAVVLFSAIFVFISFFNSFVFVTVPTEKAAEYVGTSRAARLEIIEAKQSSDTSSEYVVRIKRIGDEELNIKAYLFCEFSTELSYGDTVLAVVDIKTPTWQKANEKDMLLSLVAREGYPALYKEDVSPNYFAIDGIAALCDGMRNTFSQYVDGLFGEKDGAMVKGFLVNDTSDIPDHVKTDFQRSGTLHLLAVSGLHIVLLMGMIEFVLKKILVPKRIRCIVVAVFAVLFLALADFSASAVRSVIMLFAVYANYMLSEDSDGVTALFVSAFIIILFSPFSVYDLGLWLSFFATLGLLTVYPFLEGRLPKVKAKNFALRSLLKFGIWVIKAILLTLVANIFVLPITWYFFGEISLSAIPANLVISPFATVYLPLCAVAAALGVIPILGNVLIAAVGFLGDIILLLADAFADMKGAVLSLRYPFATPLIIVFTVIFAVMLVIKLKQKLWVCAPPVALSTIFAVCLLIFTLSSTPQVKYVSDGKGDYLFIEKAFASTVCDIGSGGYDAYEMLLGNINPYSTEIDNYVLTHCHAGHLYSTERILSAFSVRKLYLPLARNRDELEIVGKIYLLAAEYDTEVEFYDSGEEIAVDGLSLKAYFNNGDAHSSAFVTVGREEAIFTYADASESKELVSVGADSRYFLLGVHGSRIKGASLDELLAVKGRLIFANEERKSSTKITGDNSYVIAPTDNTIKLILPLD